MSSEPFYLLYTYRRIFQYRSNSFEYVQREKENFANTSTGVERWNYYKTVVKLLSYQNQDQNRDRVKSHLVHPLKFIKNLTLGLDTLIDL